MNDSRGLVVVDPAGFCCAPSVVTFRELFIDTVNEHGLLWAQLHYCGKRGMSFSEFVLWCEVCGFVQTVDTAELVIG